MTDFTRRDTLHLGFAALLTAGALPARSFAKGQGPAVLIT